jgi:hypothetical protein
VTVASARASPSASWATIFSTSRWTASSRSASVIVPAAVSSNGPTAAVISTSKPSGPARPVTRMLGTHGATRSMSVIVVQTVAGGAATENPW